MPDTSPLHTHWRLRERDAFAAEATAVLERGLEEIAEELLQPKLSVSKLDVDREESPVGALARRRERQEQLGFDNTHEFRFR